MKIMENNIEIHPNFLLLSKAFFAPLHVVEVSKTLSKDFTSILLANFMDSSKRQKTFCIKQVASPLASSG